MQLDENARRIFDLRYSVKGMNGEPTESPEEAAWRVAINVAAPNALYGGEPNVNVADDGESEPAPPKPDVKKFPYKTAERHFRYLSEGQRGRMWLRGKEPKVWGDFVSMMQYGWGRAAEQAEKYRVMLEALDFFPNSPTWTGAGTGLGQLAACFVLPIDDDLAAGRSSIFETMKVAASIQQTGGGNGFSFGRLRPNKSVVMRSMGRASGPVGFLKVYDAAFGQIAQGGSRRGANMGVLPVWHPDIEDFIAAKVVEGEIANFNISVAITDEFMDCVEKDEDFELRWHPQGVTDDPVDYTVIRTIRARELYDYLIECAWKLGDPGNLFIDRANQTNPSPTHYLLEATNPCGEQWLPPYSNCCLGSINLGNFVSDEGFIDWKRLGDTVTLATQFLDDVVDANRYVDEVPELEAAAMNERRIGLGYMGLADFLSKAGARYGGKDGLDLTSQVTEWMRYWSMMASAMRAKERGPFPWIKHSIYDPDLLAEHGFGSVVTAHSHDLNREVSFRLWERPEPKVEHLAVWNRPNLDWHALEVMVKTYGVRNATQCTIAPTGTISNVCMCEGSGCEPRFALAFVRTVMQEGQNIKLDYLSEDFERALRRYALTDNAIDSILEQVKKTGSCQGIDLVPAEVQRVFVVAADVTPSEHVWMQAVAQAFIDNSISKTINMPFEATVEDVSAAYRLAYDLGCKGITIYRQGSRELEVLSTGDRPQEVTEEAWPIITPLAIPRDAHDAGLPAKVFPIETPFGKVQVTITEHPDHPGRPFDVRLSIGKAGNDKNADVEALGRMISTATRSGVSISWIVEQLTGIGGQTISGFGPNRVTSVADGVGKLLARVYLNVQPVEVVEFTETISVKKADATQVCPKCHNATVVFDSGCFHCDIRLGGCGDYEGCA